MREVFVPRSAEVYPVFPDLFFPVAPVPIAPTVSFEKLWGLFFLRNFWIPQDRVWKLLRFFDTVPIYKSILVSLSFHQKDSDTKIDLSTGTVSKKRSSFQTRPTSGDLITQVSQGELNDVWT